MAALAGLLLAEPTVRNVSELQALVYRDEPG